MSSRSKIKESCLDLFIQNGVEGTSTKMILNASGVSNGGLFHHFSSKDEIVKEIYYDIKEEMRIYLQSKLDVNLATRPFLLTYWTEVIHWGMENKRKKLYLEMYSKSATIRNCTNSSISEKFLFITERVEKAIQNKEIVSHNLLYFLYHFTASTDAVINYLNDYPEHNSSKFLEQQFTQYWRSVVNF